MAVQAAIFPDEQAQKAAFDRAYAVMEKRPGCSVFRMSNRARTEWYVAVVGEVPVVEAFDLGGRPWSMDPDMAQALEDRCRGMQESGVVRHDAHYGEGANLLPGGILASEHPPLYEDTFACDFCSVRIEGEPWTFPCRTFYAGLGNASIEDWAACDECKPLVEAGDWDAVFERLSRNSKLLGEADFSDPDVKPMLLKMWRTFEENRTGEARKESDPTPSES